MGLRLFYLEYSWLENGNCLREATLKVCRWIFEELRCNAYQCLPGKKPMPLFKVSLLPLFWTINSSKVSPSARAHREQQINLLWNRPEHLDVGVIVSSPPNHSTPISLFIAFKIFSAQWRAFSRIKLFVYLLLNLFPISPSLSHSKGDTIVMLKKIMYNNSLGEILRNSVATG